MDIIYVTLNNLEEAKKIGRILLEKKLANCINFFPIVCMYNWEDNIVEEPETVILIKTKETKFGKIEKLIKSNIDYTNFIGLIQVHEVNNEFFKWLNRIVK